MAEEEVKRIIFKEDPRKGIKDLLDTAHTWASSNVNSVKINSGVYGLYRDDETGLHHRSIVLNYTGNQTFNNPQECSHSSKEETTISEPDCVNTGLKVMKCRSCNSIIDRTTIPTIPHNYQYIFNNDATCTGDGTETGTCPMCHGTIKRIKAGSALGHSMPNEWTTEIPATFTSTGLQSKTCTRCGHRVTEEIPMLDINLEITSILSAMLIDQPFSQQLLTNLPNEISSQVVWSLESGNIPNGLSINSSGLISGTPTSSGIHTFVVKAVYNDKVATKSFTVNIANRLLTVTFNANGGSCTESTRQVAEGSIIGELPVPTHDSMEFAGWFTAATDGLKIDSNYTVTANITLYARWGESSDIVFGDVTSEFNVQYNGDKTNYQDKPYTLYSRVAGGAAGTANLQFQTGISSTDKTSNMSSTNKKVTLYLKVTNNGESGNFDIGFDCDSFVTGNGDDRVVIKRLPNGVSLGDPVAFTVTADYDTTIWVGKFDERTDNRFNNVAVGTTTGSDTDTGYAFTMNNVFISGGSYAILEVIFQIP